MKNTTAKIAIAIAAMAAGAAFAGDAADIKMDFVGMSAREAFPANYGVVVAPGKTRAQVQAELVASHSHDAADVKMDFIGLSAREAFPANYGVVVAPGKTRAQVQAELIASRSHDAVDVPLDYVGITPRQLALDVAKAKRGNRSSTNFAGL